MPREEQWEAVTIPRDKGTNNLLESRKNWNGGGGTTKKGGRAGGGEEHAATDSKQENLEKEIPQLLSSLASLISPLVLRIETQGCQMVRDPEDAICKDSIRKAEKVWG